MRFMMLMIAKGLEPAAAGATPDAPAGGEMTKYNQSLKSAGVLLAVVGLHPPALGARICIVGGKPAVKGGPFDDAKEALGGYWMLQVKSKEEAVEWAKRCPAGDGDVIEIRQVKELTDLRADAP